MQSRISMHFSYMEFNSVHAFKAQNIAFRENPRKRTGMHQNCGFGLRKDQLFHKDFHLFSRKYIIQHKICKMQENNALDKHIENHCKKTWSLGHSKSAWGLHFIKGFQTCPQLMVGCRPGPARPGPARPGLA